jgi:histone deacetylase 1/2
LEDNGYKRGLGYAINVPLKDGITDDMFVKLFRDIVPQLIQWYNPGAIVLQAGADTLTGDRLGTFNLTIKGHTECVKIIKDTKHPLLLLGGGGYTIRNVARCWAADVATILNVDLPNTLPFTPHIHFYAPDFTLHIPASNMINENTPEELNRITETIFERIRSIPSAPPPGDNCPKH